MAANNNTNSKSSTSTIVKSIKTNWALLLGILLIIVVLVALYVIKEFSGTKAANLAKYYVGVSYFKQNDFNKAVEYLKDFSTDAKQVQAIAYGTLGDAYAELKKNDEAVEYYKKAGNLFPEDENISSEYLYRAAAFLEVNGKSKEAVEIYTAIKNKYPKSEKGLNADKYINRLQVQ